MNLANDKVIQLIKSYDEDIYLVGGAVRDFLLGKNTFDKDIIVKSAEEFASRFANDNDGTFIELDKEDDQTDQIIAYARHLNGKTLLVLANKNVNRSIACKVKVPTLKAAQELNNLLPSYGKESRFQVHDNELCVDLGPARVHVFEIDTPNIENYCKKIYKQNI